MLHGFATHIRGAKVREHTGGIEMKTAILGLASVAFLSLSTTAVGESTPPALPQDISGNEPAIPLPGENPCPACGYNVAAKRFSGVLDPTYSAHTYPLTNMKLRLFNGAGTLISGPHNLSPTSASGNQDMTQSISTSVTGGVARAVFYFHTADGYDLWQDVVVQ
jgi:hypothetical protein